jgi:hypothetical protein
MSYGMRVRGQIDQKAIERRIEDLMDLLDGGPDRAGECDRCHNSAGVWLDGATELCGDFEFCGRCLRKELTRLRALRRMGRSR